MRKKHRNRYYCVKCYRGFISKDDLEEHMKHHENITLYHCHLCPMKYRYLYSIKAHHVRVHSTVEPKSIHNKACPSRIRSYECQVCDKVYSMSTYLKAHKRIAHGIGKNIYVCKICHRKYLLKDNFRNHLCRPINARVTCPQCNKSCANKTCLEIHMQAHTGERPNKCNICSKMYTTLDSLRVHKLAHKRVKPYECDLCGKTFARRSTLMDHRRRHPGNHPKVPRVSLECFSDED
ncbi:zinc finger protein 417-like [Hylaeus volcanicus]|uniref:zinc finger protein 417-like n=1 Tax=Hylaeus volcanicus TaxID=313075 RepID=UPI0023B7C56D|nr:zinc finger protein 417-like [Hylaeus volcanicus]